MSVSVSRDFCALVSMSAGCFRVWSPSQRKLFVFVSEPCQALKDNDNICGIYVGSVRVYGEGGDPLDIIKDHLDESAEETIHPKLRRLFSVDAAGSQNIVSTPPSTSSEGISSSAIAGVAVALVTLSIGMIGLVAIQMRRRRRQSRSQREYSSSESERDESVSLETNDDIQVETVDFEPELSLVVSGALNPRSIMIDPNVLSRESDLL